MGKIKREVVRRVRLEKYELLVKETTVEDNKDFHMYEFEIKNPDEMDYFKIGYEVRLGIEEEYDEDYNVVGRKVDIMTSTGKMEIELAQTFNLRLIEAMHVAKVFQEEINKHMNGTYPRDFTKKVGYDAEKNTDKNTDVKINQKKI